MGLRHLVEFLLLAVIVRGQQVVEQFQPQEGRIVNNPGNGNRRPVLLPSNDLSDLELYEDVPVGRHIYTLKGQDPEGAPVSYTISGDYFSADRLTGKVTLVKALDREQVSSIDVVVTVQDDQPANIVALPRTIRGRWSLVYCSLFIDGPMTSQ